MSNVVFAPSMLLLVATAADWQPKTAPLMTRWAKDVKPDRVHPEYPRPQLVREAWLNLNGLWDYAIAPREASRPEQFAGALLVPFPVESALSGVMARVDENQRLWYRRTFEVPADWKPRRTLLHFGAVDWETTVWVNGKEIGQHRGGYDPFTFDITDALKSHGPQELIVAVWDPTDAGTQPRGKQVHNPEGIWYTPTTGIWQTVWLEPVPAEHIARLRLTTDVDAQTISVAAEVPGWGASHALLVTVLDGGQELARISGGTAVQIKIPNAKLWSPATPHLYDLRVQLLSAGKLVDEVASYVGLRKVHMAKDAQGVNRLYLNNQQVFMFGPLDQGFWPDGLYTAPTDEALRYDIEITKQLGFNTARKHVKVEPARWYYWCDKLGLLVWQDMPSGDRLDPEPDWKRTPESAAQYERELRAMIDAFRNHPAIVMWVPFNEAWGQFETARITQLTRDYDPTRLVNASSGWHDLGVGDVHDIHVYPGPAAPPVEPARAGVLGEFGGLGLPLPGHTWQDQKNWGYRSYTSREALTEAYVATIDQLRALIGEPGLCAAIYTQTTDVEIEVNGLLTYERALMKPDLDRVVAANRRVYLPPPTTREIVPTSRRQPQTWQYTLEQPGADWYQPTCDDSRWSRGPGGFGTEGTPGAVVRTKWDGKQIWLRRSFELDALPANPQLTLYHDDDCTVYINGHPVAEVPGYTTSYVLVPLKDPGVLKRGTNLIAIHCRQGGGGQGVDAGLVEVTEPAGQ